MFSHYGERLRFIHGQSHIHHPAAVKTLQSIKFDLICTTLKCLLKVPRCFSAGPKILMKWKFILSEGFVAMDEVEPV